MSLTIVSTVLAVVSTKGILDVVHAELTRNCLHSAQVEIVNMLAQEQGLSPDLREHLSNWEQVLRHVISQPELFQEGVIHPTLQGVLDNFTLNLQLAEELGQASVVQNEPVVLQEAEVADAEVAVPAVVEADPIGVPVQNIQAVVEDGQANADEANDCTEAELVQGLHQYLPMINMLITILDEENGFTRYTLPIRFMENMRSLIGQIPETNQDPLVQAIRGFLMQSQVLRVLQLTEELTVASIVLHNVMQMGLNQGVEVQTFVATPATDLHAQVPDAHMQEHDPEFEDNEDETLDEEYHLVEDMPPIEVPQVGLDLPLPNIQHQTDASDQVVNGVSPDEDDVVKAPRVQLTDVVDNARNLATQAVDRARELHQTVQAQLNTLDPTLIIATRAALEQIQQRAPEKVAAATRALQQALGAMNQDLAPKAPPATTAAQTVDNVVDKLRATADLASVLAPKDNETKGSLLNRVLKSAKQVGTPNGLAEVACLVKLVKLDPEDKDFEEKSRKLALRMSAIVYGHDSDKVALSLDEVLEDFIAHCEKISG